jgi:hypothetical protein
MGHTKGAFGQEAAKQIGQAKGRQKNIRPRSQKVRQKHVPGKAKEARGQSSPGQGEGGASFPAESEPGRNHADTWYHITLQTSLRAVWSVKIAKQKNAVFCLAHAACGGAPGLSARR